MGWSSGLTLGSGGGTPTEIVNDGGSVAIDSSGNILATVPAAATFIITGAHGDSIEVGALGAITLVTATGQALTLDGAGGSSIIIDSSGNISLTTGIAAHVEVIGGMGSLLEITSAGTLSLITTVGTALLVESSGQITLGYGTSTGGSISLDTSGNITIEPGGSANLTLTNALGATIEITGAGALLLNTEGASELSLIGFGTSSLILDASGNATLACASTLTTLMGTATNGFSINDGTGVVTLNSQGTTYLTITHAGLLSLGNSTAYFRCNSAGTAILHGSGNGEFVVAATGDCIIEPGFGAGLGFFAGGPATQQTGDVGAGLVAYGLMATPAYSTSLFLGTISAGNMPALTGDVTSTVNTVVTTVGKIGGQAVSLGGALTTAGAVTFSGAHACTLDITGATNVTLPTSGTLLTGNQTITLTGDATGSGTTAITTAVGHIGGQSISLGGTFQTAGPVQFSGVHVVTFTFTANTSVTFPTSGTLSTTTGTVTSVSVTGPTGLLTWSSGVTSAGTITASLSTQTANTVFAGPASGSAAAPTFRSLVTADLASSIVTYAKVQNVTASRLLGNPTGGSAAPSEISLGTNLSFSGSVLNATGGPTLTTADLTAQTASVSSVVSATAPAGASHQYLVGCYCSITAISGMTTLSMTVTWTDENSNAQTLTLVTYGSATSSLILTGTYAFAPLTIRAKASSTVAVNAVVGGVGPSITYDVGGSLSQLN